MDQDSISRLVNEASKYGARGYQVLGWIPPQTGSEAPNGKLIVQDMSNISTSASTKSWYE